jgi:hypothetical protein
LVGRGVSGAKRGAVDDLNPSSTPEILGYDGLIGFANEVIVDVLKSLERQSGPSLAVGAVLGGRGCLIGLKGPGLSLADSGAATGTCLSELPGGCPEDEAKGPAALPGVGTLIGLGEQVGWDPTVEERGQLMDGRGAGGLDGAELCVEEVGELGEEGSHW